MAMHKSGVKHMSADAEDRFAENLEGEDFGSLDDWETDLGLKILTIEKKLASAEGQANQPVHNMLAKKLVTYNAALEFLSENAKAAAMIGSQGGLQSIIAYITKQAVDDAAKAETRKYSNKIIPHLPGYVLSSQLTAQGGLVGARTAGGAIVAQVDGSKYLAAV
jgi:hypothetical protein